MRNFAVTTMGSPMVRGLSSISEPSFYFTSSVLFNNAGHGGTTSGDGVPVAPNGSAVHFSASVGTAGDFIGASPAVYLNGIRLRSGTNAQVVAGTRDYEVNLINSASNVNFLVVHMANAPLTGDVVMADFRRSLAGSV